MDIDDKNIRLGVAFPVTSGHVPTRFAMSMMACKLPPRWTLLTPPGGGPIDSVRNSLVDMALKLDLTHLAMLDTDQVYPQDTFTKLFSHDLPIVVAKVHRRYPPFDPILYRGGIDDFKAVSDAEWIRHKDKPIEVDSTGMGCALIQVDVLRAIKPPWFRWLLYDRETPVGEDVYFWNQCKKAGYKIHVDLSIEISHLGMMDITEQSYWAYKHSQSFAKGPE